MKRKTPRRRKRSDESHSLPAQNLGVHRARLATAAQLPHAVLSACALDSHHGNDVLLHLENFCGPYRSALRAMEQSFGGVAHRAGGVELFHDWFFEFSERDSARAGTRNSGKRSDDAD